MNKKNMCILSESGFFLCTVNWDGSGPHDCKFRARDTLINRNCDFFEDCGGCLSRQAAADAARASAKASLEKCRKNTDAVLDALNKMAFFVLQEGRKGPGGDDEGDGDA
jgi:hypothetical protein